MCDFRRDGHVTESRSGGRLCPCGGPSWASARMRAAVMAVLIALCMISCAYCFADEGSAPTAGTCSRGEEEGTGTCSYETGDIYEVYCGPPPRGRAAAAAPGRCRQLSLTCLCVAQGHFDEEGLPHGQGKYFYAGGETYEGAFVNGHLEGPGTFIYSRCAFRGRSSRLCACVCVCVKCRACECACASWPARRSGATVLRSGDTYEGEWLQGKMHGEGKYHYATGDVYQGTFKEGLMHGIGWFFPLSLNVIEFFFPPTHPAIPQLPSLHRLWTGAPD
jgi:hypothetical protein